MSDPDGRAACERWPKVQPLPHDRALLAHAGRDHHTVGMGGITEIATSAPGYNSMRPNSCAPLAETLKLNGYSTAQFGKCHEVPVFEATPIGPFHHWATGSGFEHFYGFIGGENNQYHPALYDGTTPIEPERTPEEGYHLMEDLADKAIAWIWNSLRGLRIATTGKENTDGPWVCSTI